MRARLVEDGRTLVRGVSGCPPVRGPGEAALSVAQGQSASDLVDRPGPDRVTAGAGRPDLAVPGFSARLRKHSAASPTALSGGQRETMKAGRREAVGP